MKWIRTLLVDVKVGYYAIQSRRKMRKMNEDVRPLEHVKKIADMIDNVMLFNISMSDLKVLNEIKQYNCMDEVKRLIGKTRYKEDL